MAFCKHCGNELQDDAKFCPSCGAPVEAASTPIVTAAPVAEKKERQLNITQLVLSIINIVTCGQIFGIIALIMTILAKSAEDDESEAGKIRVAKILNIIGFVATALSLIGYVIGFIALIIAGINDPEFAAVIRFSLF